MSKAKDIPFLASIKQASQDEKMYLGDIAAVTDMLELYVEDAMEWLDEVSDADWQERVEMQAEYMARIFLGLKDRLNVTNSRVQGDQWEEVPSWNKAGAIDVFVSKWLGVDENEPLERMKGAFIHLIADIFELVEWAEDQDVDDEMLKGNIEGVIEKYANCLIGVCPKITGMLEDI